ncbi:MAG: SDR family oxidoreductase [Moorea sp. SIO2I5]|nr:SDR family oxidoreductase [Moorena sp. SIO2I5]
MDITQPHHPSFNEQELAICLRVLEAAGRMSSDNPQLLTIERAVSALKKQLKQKRRHQGKQARRQHDLALLARAQIHSEALPERLRQLAAGVSLDHDQLYTPQLCYVCKQPYKRVHHFYHQFCPNCAPEHYSRRYARTDLQGRRVLVTGGRIKIGYHVALKMLRDGAHVIVTTRFPKDAARRYLAETDSHVWGDRLEIYGLDFRDLRGVMAFIDQLLASAPLNIIINNAAQTIRRPPAYFKTLVQGEMESLDQQTRQWVKAESEALVKKSALNAFYQLCLSSKEDPNFPDGVLDIEGQPLDLRHVNSWRLLLDQVEPIEMVEAWLVTTMAPYLFNSRLKPSLMASPFEDRYIVNVSAVEGQFSYGNKTPYHPHTNMAKAALNMMTRTVGMDYVCDRIYMTSVDTGWITDEKPHPVREYLRQQGFRPPLDVIDGAARVYDPIVRGLAGERLYGVFLKDYKPCDW